MSKFNCILIYKSFSHVQKSQIKQKLLSKLLQQSSHCSYSTSVDMEMDMWMYRLKNTSIYCLMSLIIQGNTREQIAWSKFYLELQYSSIQWVLFNKGSEIMYSTACFPTKVLQTCRCRGKSPDSHQVVVPFFICSSCYQLIYAGKMDH